MDEKELILQITATQRNQLLDQVTVLTAKVEILSRELNTYKQLSKLSGEGKGSNQTESAV